MAVQTTLLTSNRNIARELLDQETVVRAYVDTSTTNLTSGDYYRLFYYPANTLINEVHVITETVEGAADTTDITDDETGTTTLVTNHDLNTDNAISKYTTSLFKAAAGYICIKPDAALTVCKFWVSANIIMYKTTD